jgi:hypothetical protein
MSGRISLWVLLILFGLVLFPASGYAQSQPAAELSLPVTDQFPEISAYLSVFNQQGRVLRGLQASQIRILENDQPASVTRLEYFEPGVQFVVALNPGPTFAIRNSRGISRYDLIRQALLEWIATYPATTKDDLSLLALNGPRNSHIPSPREWQRALESYAPDARNFTPAFDLLAEAIDIASDTPPQPGMAKVVLFITSPPEREAIPAIQNLVSQALQQGVLLNFWLVGSDATLDNGTFIQLGELAAQTGGEVFRFSGTETLPDIETYLEPIRGLYQVFYQSTARSSGEYQTQAEIRAGGEIILSEPRQVTLEVLPPNPVFVALPTSIERKPPELENGENSVGLIPTAHSLQIIIEFPDGHPRQIQRSTLLVDGEVVQENREPPFDTFLWDLSGYTTHSEHLLQVEVEDDLGLVGSSIDTPIRIQIAGMPSGFAAVLVENAPVIALLGGLAAGAILLWVLVLGGRLQPADVTRPRLRRRDKDPVTQPVSIRTERPKRPRAPQRLKNLASRLRWPSRQQIPEPIAFLELLGPDSNGSRGVTQPILEDELIFGRSAQQANTLVEHPSVSEVHARLVRQSNGEFWLYDAGSIAGTWVNYNRVPKDGQRLEYGDLIHIGKIGYRFRLADQGQARRISITREINPH